MSWLRLAFAAVLASTIAFGGYKIGTWRGAAEGANAAKIASDNLATCTADLATQRESDLIGANHALADQLQTAIDTATKDAASLATLAERAQANAIAFAADTRAVYEIAVGSCSFTPEFVGLLDAISRQANRHRAPATAPAKTDSSNAPGAAVPIPSSKPRSAVERGAGATSRPVVDGSGSSVHDGH